jgi:hypothetical protein
MADIVLQKNIGALIDVKPLLPVLSWTAGGSSDSVTWTGAAIDRGGFGEGAGGLTATPMPYSADVDIIYSATLGSGATLAFNFDLQTSPDNSTWTDYATVAAATIATGPSGGGAVSGVQRLVLSATANPNAPSRMAGVDLTNAQRYVRLLALPHLSRTGTDTAVIVGVGIFAGFDRLPAATT